MKNRILLVFLAIVLVVSLAAFVACAKEEEAPPVEEVWQWPDKLLLGASSIQSPAYASAIGWTTPFAKDTGVKVRVVIQSDQRLKHLWLRDGVLDISSLIGAGRNMLIADRGFATRDAGPFEMRAFWTVGRMDRGYITTPGTGLKTPHDIKPGARIVYMTHIPPGRTVMLALLAWAQVDPEDVVWVPAGGTTPNMRFIMEGKGDVAQTENPMSPLIIEAEASPRGLSWIEFDWEKDPEGAARYLEVWPYFLFGTMTQGVTAKGIKSFTSTSTYLTVADKDPELIYQLVKWLVENHDKYKDTHPHKYLASSSACRR